MEGRGGGIGLVDGVVGDSGLPKNLSFHGKGGGLSGSVVKEIDERRFPSPAGEPEAWVPFLFSFMNPPSWICVVQRSSPVERSRQRTLWGLLLFVCGGENNSITDHDGRAVSAPGNFRFPNDVFRITPIERQILSRGSQAIFEKVLSTVASLRLRLFPSLHSARVRPNERKGKRSIVIYGS